MMKIWKEEKFDEERTCSGEKRLVIKVGQGPQTTKGVAFAETLDFYAGAAPACLCPASAFHRTFVTSIIRTRPNVLFFCTYAPFSVPSPPYAWHRWRAIPSFRVICAPQLSAAGNLSTPKISNRSFLSCLGERYSHPEMPRTRVGKCVVRGTHFGTASVVVSARGCRVLLYVNGVNVRRLRSCGQDWWMGQKSLF